MNNSLFPAYDKCNGAIVTFIRCKQLFLKDTLKLSRVKQLETNKLQLKEKTMSNLNDKFNALYSVDAVQDLTNENAASISGGRSDVTIYDGENFTPGMNGVKISNEGIKDLRLINFNDKTSSIKVDGVVNKKVWRFYENANFSGKAIDVKPGGEIAKLPPGFNNQISSFKSIG
jgi:Beta/Gamma crystallin